MSHLGHCFVKHKVIALGKLSNVLCLVHHTDVWVGVALTSIIINRIFDRGTLWHKSKVGMSLELHLSIHV
jgi:hypothetical protein